MALLDKTGIEDGERIDGVHVSNIYDALSESGSFTIQATGSFTGSFTGVFTGTSTVTHALTASFAISASHEITKEVSSSFADLSGNLTGEPNINVTQITASSTVAIGPTTIATGASTLAQGSGSDATGDYSHAQGRGTIASGFASHAEGLTSIANGSYSHAEGRNTRAEGSYSHAQGRIATASGDYTHAGGYGTVASGNYQLVAGQFNISSSNSAAFIIGDGADANNRSNILFAGDNKIELNAAVTASGNISGSSTSNITIGGTVTATSGAFSELSGNSPITINSNVNFTGNPILKAFSEDGEAGLTEIYNLMEVTGSVDGTGNAVTDINFLSSDQSDNPAGRTTINFGTGSNAISSPNIQIKGLFNVDTTRGITLKGPGGGIELSGSNGNIQITSLIPQVTGKGDVGNSSRIYKNGYIENIYTTQIIASSNISSSRTVTGLTGSFSHLVGNSPIEIGSEIVFQQPVSGSAFSGSFFGSGVGLQVGTIPLPAGILSSSTQIGSDISGSIGATSASFSSRTTTLESNPVFSAAGISGSFTATSASFSTRVTTLEDTTDDGTFAHITASGNISASGNFIGEVTGIGGAVTGITSLLATDIKIGEDDETKIDFEDANEIHFYAANVHQVKLVDNAFTPAADSDVDLGGTSTFWKDAYIDSITTSGNVSGSILSTASFAKFVGDGSAITNLQRPITTVGTNPFTASLDNAGQYFRVGGNVTCSIKVAATASCEIGSEYEFIQTSSAGYLQFTTDPGVTLNSKGSKTKLAGQFSGATLKKIGTDEWDLIGDLG
jgi:hypothetical protein